MYPGKRSFPSLDHFRRVEDRRIGLLRRATITTTKRWVLSFLHLSRLLINRKTKDHPLPSNTFLPENSAKTELRKPKLAYVFTFIELGLSILFHPDRKNWEQPKKSSVKCFISFLVFFIFNVLESGFKSQEVDVVKEWIGQISFCP